MIILSNYDYFKKRLGENESIKIHTPIPIESIPNIFIVGIVVKKNTEESPQDVKEIAIREDTKNNPDGEYNGFWLDSYLFHYAFAAPTETPED